MITSISEHVKALSAMTNDEDQYNYLLQHETDPLKKVLAFNYDKENVKFLLPKTPPVWKPSPYLDLHGGLYKEARKLNIFIEGGGYDAMDQKKRELLFVRFLEEIEPDDARLVIAIVQQIPFKNLSYDTIKAAYPKLLP